MFGVRLISRQRRRLLGFGEAGPRGRNCVRSLAEKIESAGYLPALGRSQMILVRFQIPDDFPVSLNGQTIPERREEARNRASSVSSAAAEFADRLVVAWVSSDKSR